jgi:hypothetical protein
MILIEIQLIETAHSEPLKLFGLSPLLLRMHGMLLNTWLSAVFLRKMTKRYVVMRQSTAVKLNM